MMPKRRRGTTWYRQVNQEVDNILNKTSGSGLTNNPGISKTLESDDSNDTRYSVSVLSSTGTEFEPSNVESGSGTDEQSSFSDYDYWSPEENLNPADIG